MNVFRSFIPSQIAIFCLFASPYNSQAQTQPAVADAKKTLGVAAISPTPSLKTATDQAGKTLSMGQVVESIDGQLIDSFNSTRKFQLVAVSDLKELVKKQELAHSGNYDANDPALPGLFKLAGTEYHLITAVDNFQDITRTEKLSQETITVREIRLSAVGKIYSTQKGTLLESANFQFSTNKIIEEFNTAGVDGNRSDDLFVAIAREMAGKIANRVADVMFPAKVISKRDKQIMVNRGDGTGLVVGQVWDVFAVGDELIDPDTKESLGREEVLIGKARVKTIQPKTMTAELLEDNGVIVGAVLRLPQEKAAEEISSKR